MSVGVILDNAPDFGIVTTTDATVTYLMSHDIPHDSACHFDVRVVCRNPANGDCRCWHWEILARRVGTGTPALAMTTVKTIDAAGDASLAGVAITISANASGNARVNVTGLAGTTLEWYGRFSGTCIEGT